MKTTLPFLFLLFTLGSCMKNTRLQVLQPAVLTVPDHINTIALVDRSKPSNGWLNVLEGIFTGEAIGQDRRSREEAVHGLTNALTRTPRFQVKNTGIEMTGSKAGNNLPVRWEVSVDANNQLTYRVTCRMSLLGWGADLSPQITVPIGSVTGSSFPVLRPGRQRLTNAQGNSWAVTPKR